MPSEELSTDRFLQTSRTVLKRMATTILRVRYTDGARQPCINHLMGGWCWRCGLPCKVLTVLLRNFLPSVTESTSALLTVKREALPLILSPACPRCETVWRGFAACPPTGSCCSDRKSSSRPLPFGTGRILWRRGGRNSRDTDEWRHFRRQRQVRSFHGSRALFRTPATLAIECHRSAVKVVLKIEEIKPLNTTGSDLRSPYSF